VGGAYGVIFPDAIVQQMAKGERQNHLELDTMRILRKNRELSFASTAQ
jgi:hypothetical protein